MTPYQNDWRNLSARTLEPHFSEWMDELTKQGLHEKADIAKVLAFKDQCIEKLDSLFEGSERDNSALEHQFDALEKRFNALNKAYDEVCQENTWLRAALGKTSALVEAK